MQEESRLNAGISMKEDREGRIELEDQLTPVGF